MSLCFGLKKFGHFILAGYAVILCIGLDGREGMPGLPGSAGMKGDRGEPGISEGGTPGTFRALSRVLSRWFTDFDFIARQFAMHAERDIVLPILSVCLSVCLSVQSNAGTASKRVDISSHFLSF